MILASFISSVSPIAKDVSRLSCPAYLPQTLSYRDINSCYGSSSPMGILIEDAYAATRTPAEYSLAHLYVAHAMTNISKSLSPCKESGPLSKSLSLPTLRGSSCGGYLIENPIFFVEDPKLNPIC
jgi:hypothetical protein